MKAKKITLYLAGLLFLGTQWQCSDSSGESQSTSAPDKTENIRKFATQSAEPQSIKHSISLTGRVVPQQKIDVVAQVQGVAESRRKPFEEGQTFQQGEVLLSLDDDEWKGNPKNQIVLIGQNLEHDKLRAQLESCVCLPSSNRAQGFGK